MIRVADYIAQALVAAGITDVFMVTGGGAMHLNDAIGRCQGLQHLPCHHEQACAMAAESYFRLTGRLAAVNVTAGPGGTNAITGVHGAWTDSMGMVVISGQVRRETLVQSTGLPLRQMGDQEIDIVRMVQPITKYAVMITDPGSVRFHLEKAIHLARTGRPGPVWIDVPMDIQGTQIDPERLPGFTAPADHDGLTGEPLAQAAQAVLAQLKAAKRPAIIAGSGVRTSGGADLFLAVADRLGIPVTTAFNGHDLIPADHPCLTGRPGTIGDRAGNFTVQNADFLLILASRMNIRQVSYNWQSFGREATKVLVDIDPAELKKPSLSPEVPIHADAAEFLRAILDQPWDGRPQAHADYLAWCRERVDRYPVLLPEYSAMPAPVNPYCFVQALFAELGEDEIIVTGDGTACVATFQAAKLKRGQRLWSNSGSAPMGYDLPAAIGAAVAAPGQRIICLAGDGSMQMNVQELATIATHRLPVKIFLFNNGGYLSIRQTQENFFPDNPVGCGPESGVGFPDFALLAQAYRLPYCRIADHPSMPGQIRDMLERPGAMLCEVVLDPSQGFSPKLSSRRLDDGRLVTSPLEDMAPFLSREELRANMLIPLVEP